MNKKPTTADQIRQAIQHSINIQRLEQLTIDALTRDLEKIEAEQIKTHAKTLKKGKIIKHFIQQTTPTKFGDQH